MKTLKIKIDCGDKTCSSDKGKFCRFEYASVTGSFPRCDLFDKPLLDKDGGIMGWLLRCKECLDAEIKGE